MGSVASICVTRRGDGALSATGNLSASLGHPVPLAGGGADGIFAGWHWEDGRLAIAADRHGFYPLFSWTTRDRCVIASDLAALIELGAPAALDFDALSVFVRLGFFVGDDTPFAAIRAVPPGAVLEWHDSGPAIAGSRPAVRAQPLGRQAAIEAYISLFNTAIARRLPAQEYEMPLSGGRDSRHILLALMAAGARPRACVTVPHFPPRGNDDITVAAALCQRLNVPHVVLSQYDDRAATEREKNTRTHFLTDEHAQFVALADYLRRVTRETYDGIAGDVLSQSSYLTPESHAAFAGGDVAAAAANVLGGRGTTVSEPALERLLSPALMRAVPRARAVARLAGEVARHFDAPNPVSSFYFWNRTRREIALGPYGVMRGVNVHAPFLDRDLFDLLASLPASLVMDRRLHTDAIGRAYPQMADVPYEAKEEASSPRSCRRLAMSLMATVLSSLDLLRGRSLLPRLAATAIDGDAARLWHAPMTLYLGQLAGLAAARAT